MTINKTLKILSLSAIFFVTTVAISSTASAEEKVLKHPLSHALMSVDDVIYARALKLKSLNDETIDIKDLKGKSVIVNFWATSCPPCREEMASLDRFHKEMRDKNTEVLTVNIGEEEDTVKAFMDQLDPKPEFKVLMNKDASVAKYWGVSALPTTFIINPRGEIAYGAVGGIEFDHPDIIQSVKALNLYESASATTTK